MKAGDKVYTATVDRGGVRDDGFHSPRVVVSEATVDMVGPCWAVVTGEVCGVPARKQSFPLSALFLDREGSVDNLLCRLEFQILRVQSDLNDIKDRRMIVADWLRKARAEANR